MDKREEISKGAYLFFTSLILFVGILVNASLSYNLITGGWNYYYFAWSSLACIMIGVGMGLASARAFKIKGVDK